MPAKDKAADKPATKEENSAAVAGVVNALGGPPVPVPPPVMPTSKITAGPQNPLADGPLPTVSSQPERKANPLFDGPSDDERRAGELVRRLRSQLGNALTAADSAAEFGRLILDTVPAESLSAAAKREGFDLKSAEKVIDTLADFVESQKPAVTTPKEG